MSWTFNNQAVTDDIVPENAIGFIYIITSPEGKRYLGRKMLKSTKTKTTKGVKKKIKVDSDWKDYWSSSPDLKATIAERGLTGFKREIIYFAYTKGMMLYAEEKALYALGALESDDWLNGNIRAKVYRTWVDKNTSHLLNEAIKRQSSESSSKASSSASKDAEQKGQN